MNDNMKFDALVAHDRERKRLSYKAEGLRDTVHRVCSVLNKSGFVNNPGLLRTNHTWSMTYYELLNEIKELESIMNGFNKKVNKYKVSANLPIFQAVDLEINQESNNER